MTVIDGEVTESTDSTETAAPEPTLDDLAAEYGTVLAFEAKFKEWSRGRRADLYQRMLAAREQTGGAMRSIAHKYGGNDKQVTFSLKGSDEKFTITDEDAFKEWVEANFPGEIETVIQVRPAFQKQMLDKLLVESDGVVYVKGGVSTTEKVAGEEVPGVTHTPASDDPTGFNTSWKGGDAAKDAALSTLGFPVIRELVGGDA